MPLNLIHFIISKMIEILLNVRFNFNTLNIISKNNIKIIVKGTLDNILKFSFG